MASMKVHGHPLDPCFRNPAGDDLHPGIIGLLRGGGSKGRRFPNLP